MVGRISVLGGPGLQLPPSDARSLLARPLHRARAMSFRPRIAVASPSVAESRALADWLTEEGFEPIRLSTSARVAEELANCALHLLVVDEASAVAAVNAVRARGRQLPVVVLGDSNAEAESHAQTRGAVYMTRPLDRALFLCTISMAIAETLPARRSARTATRLAVVVHGVPSQIVDVSREGMRIEMAKRLAVPPPVFDVVVPMLGTTVKVRRMWSAGAPQSDHGAVWYGGELSNNSKRAELSWHTLVDMLSGSRAMPKDQ